MTHCSRGCSTNTFVIIGLIKWEGHPFIPDLQITERARELKFWENVHPPPCVPCHVSHVTCHMSGITCYMSCVMCPMSHFFFTKFELIGGGSVINRAYPVYFFFNFTIFSHYFRVHGGFHKYYGWTGGHGDGCMNRETDNLVSPIALHDSILIIVKQTHTHTHTHTQKL